MPFVAQAIIEKFQPYTAEFIKIRQQIHQHPELGFEEFITSDLVAKLLAEWGYEVERHLGGTGVVGKLTKGNGTRKIGIRADMDALPILETTQLPYSSQHHGIMHACGHDGHTAMLLAAAKYLAEQGNFSGTLTLIFQPAEEGLGGALKMLEDGLFKKYPCDAIFAMHNMPGIPVGHFHFREGPAMASSDNVTIKLTGIGGHGAMPQSSIDPIVAASHIVIALQSIVSRNVDPRETAIITVGAITAGKANNVIPQNAEMKLSVRALHPDVRKLLEKRIHEIVHNLSAGFGVTAEIDYQRGYSVLVNTREETNFARQIARELVPNEHINEQTEPLTGSEDFAFMLEERPGCYLFIGNGAGDHRGACMVHNPGYDFNDEILATGATYWIHLTERYLAHN